MCNWIFVQIFTHRRNISLTSEPPKEGKLAVKCIYNVILAWPRHSSSFPRVLCRGTVPELNLVRKIVWRWKSFLVLRFINTMEYMFSRVVSKITLYETEKRWSPDPLVALSANDSFQNYPVIFSHRSPMTRETIIEKGSRNIILKKYLVLVFILPPRDISWYKYGISTLFFKKVS